MLRKSDGLNINNLVLRSATIMMQTAIVTASLSLKVATHLGLGFGYDQVVGFVCC